MVDPERVVAVLERLEDERKQLGELAKTSPQELLSDRVRLSAVKYGFVVAIEACIDVANHIIASENLRAPEGYADAFTVLADAALLPSELAENMRAMVGFQNLLIHVYAKVDEARVLDILRTRLDDLRRFAMEIAKAIRK